MKLTSESFQPGAPIPERYALCKRDPKTKVTFSENLSPHLAWSGAPSGTQSLVLICHDSDAPTRPDDVNKEGRVVPASLPRADFTHWVLVDLPKTGDLARRGRLFARGDAARQAGGAGPAGHSPGTQRLHLVVCGRQRHERELLRLRRAVPALERRPRAPLSLHALRALRAAMRGQRGLHARRRAQGDRAGHARHRIDHRHLQLQPRAALIQMIERHVYVKLKPEFANEAVRAEVRARSLELCDVPGVRSVTVGHAG